VSQRLNWEAITLYYATYRAALDELGYILKDGAAIAACGALRMGSVDTLA
jgi:hypothetical protein